MQDRDGKGLCDVREIGTIVRHLGICPTEIELRDMITEIEEEEPTGFIRFERFERMMTRILLENQYPRDSEDKLLRAFRVRDALNPIGGQPEGAPRLLPRPNSQRTSSLYLTPRAILSPPPPQTLDPENKGYVEAEKVRTLLTTHGERFSAEEIDDFLNFAVDADSGLLHYEDYVVQVTTS